MGLNGRDRGDTANGRPVTWPAGESPPESVSTIRSARARRRLPVRSLLIPGMRKTWAELHPGKGPRKRFGFFEELERELDRSRRYGHPLFLARISCRSDRRAPSDRTQEAASALSAILRSVDRVWTHGTAVYLLLPEADRAQGLAVLARIREPLSQLLSAREQDSISFAAWPDDCLTGGALLEVLQRRATIAKCGRIGPVPGRSTVQPKDDGDGTG